MEFHAEEKKELEVRDHGGWAEKAECSDVVEDVEADDEDDEDDEAEEEDDDDSVYVDLPPELSALQDKTFIFWDDLEKDLRERELEDLNVVIDPVTRKARLKMTKGAHDTITNLLARDFNETWGKNRWAVAAEPSSVIIQAAQPGHKLTRRKPDIAFWGFHKCTAKNRRKRLVPNKMDPPPPNEQVDMVQPDVVFQFSWGNSMRYEQEALDDMMNRAAFLPAQAQPNIVAPRMGFLVKVRKKKKRNNRGRKIVDGVDLYRVPRGTTVADAIANRNGASFVRYARAPEDKDVSFEITAKDLGIEGFWGMICQKPFRVPLELICEELD